MTVSMRYDKCFLAYFQIIDSPAGKLHFTIFHCLVPRPHYSARPKRFGSRGPIENFPKISRPFASDMSPK